MSFDMKRQIGVCMLTGVFYPEISGGGLQCRTLINSLKDKGIKFFVLTTTRDSSLKDFKSDVDIVRVVIKELNMVGRLNAFLQFTLAFLKLERQIDIVHLHGFSDKTLLVILLAKIFRKKIIQKISSLGDDDPISIFQKRFGWIKKFLFGRADLFISINPIILKVCLDSNISESKVLTIPNAVDTERFYPANDLSEKQILRSELNLPLDGAIVLFVGFFSKDKGPNILFEAWKKLKKQMQQSDIRLLFIGSTDTSYFEIKFDIVKKIKDDIRAHGMGKEVIFVEKTLQIEKYYKASDVFVLPSLREGLPNALLEAMSTALPCISADLKGVADYLISDKKEGLIFTPGDIEGLSKAICALLNDKNMAEELGRNARKKILDKFSIDKVSIQYQYLYDKLAKDNKC